jgi:hypothetical protein
VGCVRAELRPMDFESLMDSWFLGGLRVPVGRNISVCRYLLYHCKYYLQIVLRNKKQVMLQCFPISCVSLSPTREYAGSVLMNGDKISISQAISCERKEKHVDY